MFLIPTVVHVVDSAFCKGVAADLILKGALQVFETSRAEKSV